MAMSLNAGSAAHFTRSPAAAARAQSRKNWAVRRSARQGARADVSDKHRMSDIYKYYLRAFSCLVRIVRFGTSYFFLSDRLGEEVCWDFFKPQDVNKLGYAIIITTVGGLHVRQRRTTSENQADPFNWILDFYFKSSIYMYILKVIYSVLNCMFRLK